MALLQITGEIVKEFLVVLDGARDHVRRVKEAIALVNGVQRYFRLTLAEEALPLSTGQETIDCDEAYRLADERYGGQKVICVVSRPFDDGYFLHASRNCSITTLSDWEEEFAPPSLRAYLIYQLAQACLALESDLTEDMIARVVHDPPVGCLADLCENKHDIKLGMVAGNLCPQCVGILRQYGVDGEAIDATRQIVMLVREEAIGQPRIIDLKSAFVVMRFSANDENDNAFRYGVRPGLEDVGLQPLRADNTVTSGQILDKVFHLIERSRFIVAKVDEENLNVFFELGAAMGLGKDVLLVSESSLVLKLPSDLRNWECLTYQRGDYQQLRQRIAQYYRDSFGL